MSAVLVRIFRGAGCGLRIAGLSLAIGFLLLPGTAHAYLDPGTGSIIFQVIIGGLVMIIFAAKTVWAKFKGLFFKSTDPARKD